MALVLSSCSRVVEAAPLKAIVLPAIGRNVGIQLREQDLSWKDFLSSASRQPRYVYSNGMEICPVRHLLVETKVHFYVLVQNSQQINCSHLILLLADQIIIFQSINQ